MPTSISEKTAEEAPMVSLSKDNLVLNEKNLLKVNNFAIPGEALDQGQIIKPLLSGLQALKEKKKDKEELLLQIDKDCPYPNVKQILSTASMAGFIKVRLATISSN